MKVLKITVILAILFSLAAFIAAWVIGAKSDTKSSSGNTGPPAFAVGKVPLYSHTASNVGFTESFTDTPNVTTFTIVVPPPTTFLTVSSKAPRLNHTATSGVLINATALPLLRPIQSATDQ